MDQLSSQIIDVLEVQYRLHQEILELSRSKTDIIVEGRIQDLDKIVKMEQSLIIQIGKLENKREELLKELAERLNVSVEDLNLKNLAKRMDPHKSKQIMDIGKRFEELTGEQKKFNQLNSSLIKKNLEFIAFSLEVLTQDRSSGNIYQKEGDQTSKIQRNLFDAKV